MEGRKEASKVKEEGSFQGKARAHIAPELLPTIRDSNGIFELPLLQLRVVQRSP